MRINSNLPKTFAIYVENGNKKGYVRFVSVRDEESGEFYFKLTVVRGRSEASKYVNFDNVRQLASEYKKKYGFTDVKVLDEKLERFYSVK